MQFKHPEFLYALFALIIPIIVHLFQLRKFQKVDFTNVQFLKKVSLQTRKSSQIKKWLTLITRLLLFASIIIAFAQPFLANAELVGKENNTVIYLDNSFSMEAKGTKGPLLKRAVQELLSELPENEQFSLFTNTETFTNVSKKDIQNDLLQLDYTSNQLPYTAAYFKASQMLGNKSEEIKRILFISDFQQKNDPISFPERADTELHLINLAPVTNANISIDSLFLEKNNQDDLLLQVRLSASGRNTENTSISLYNGEKLLGKTSVSIPINQSVNATFKLTEEELINGKVSIDDPGLTFDNQRFFSLNPSKKINVVVIGNANDNYLKNIFTQDEFNFVSYSFNTINYNDFSTADIVVINELSDIPASLINSLKSLRLRDGYIVFIPSEKGNLESYNQFLTDFNASVFNQISESKKKITTIRFSHPLYQGVFDKEVSNFQYPEVNSYYRTQTSDAILLYEDEGPFLYKSGNLFVFTSALNKENSNFKNSPLIVPTIYNMGKRSVKIPDISYTIGKSNIYEIPVVLGQDGVLTLESNNESIIPLQQSLANKVQLNTSDVPTKSGIYAVKNRNEVLQYVSYNYDSSESNLNYYNLSENERYSIHSNVTDILKQIKEDGTINELWKWFVIFALIFLLIEILLLKYLK